MTPHDGTFQYHDWCLWRHYFNQYPQLQSEFQVLWEEMHAYDQSIWYKRRNDHRYTFSERPEVPVCISKIIAPDGIEPFWFSEWSDSEFPFECEPRCKPEEVGLFTRAELIAREEPAKLWFYASSGIALGPVSLWWLAQLIAADRFRPDDLLWREGLENWIPASEVDGLDFGKLAPAEDSLEVDEQLPEASVPAVPIVGLLKVSGRDLATAFKPIARATGVGRRTVSFEFRDGQVVIGFDELRIAIPAVGVWPGVAVVSRAFVKKMATFDLEKLPMIPIAYHNGRITIAERSNDCQWTDS